MIPLFERITSSLRENGHYRPEKELACHLGAATSVLVSIASERIGSRKSAVIFAATAVALEAEVLWIRDGDRLVAEATKELGQVKRSQAFSGIRKDISVFEPPKDLVSAF
ncbi:hypothetical protein M1349_00315 [Patescibacteria group bacterium]|nr:hypothetical protein [Patescibacteria group bacterium]